ncbi:response regulator [Candidatus Obscuribacterales bacterium]|jgi:CheY-like chemotaxis protein|nr:response regulator [Candidatus Obscuribacterales bacterium]
MAQCNILIVEDNDLQQALYRALSKKYNFDLTMVKTSREALETLHKNPTFDLILMDLGLADTNGCECSRRIREAEIDLGVRIPIVAVTGHTTEEYKNECFEAGMDGFLSKPFSVTEFGAAIKRFSRSPVTID